MKVIDEKPVPIYQLTCQECKSVIEYKASEVQWCHIICPVCGVGNWANTICATRYELPKEETDGHNSV